MSAGERNTAKCARCGQDVPTPAFLNSQGWWRLTCPHCKVRLERKRPLSMKLVLLELPLFALIPALHSIVFDVAVAVFALATAVLGLLEVLQIVRPRLRVRKRLPKPTVLLKLN